MQITLRAGASDTSQSQGESSGLAARCQGTALFRCEARWCFSVFCLEVSGLAQSDDTQEEGNHKQLKTHTNTKRGWGGADPHACPLEPCWDPGQRSRAVPENTGQQIYKPSSSDRRERKQGRNNALQKMFFPQINPKHPPAGSHFSLQMNRFRTEKRQQMPQRCSAGS